jgi:very-short-patch-repair endonuclease
MASHVVRTPATELIITAVRTLRKESTLAEQRFWQTVRDREIDGLRFYRQHPIEFEMDGYKRFFIADFYCKKLKLVVEIDGGIHENQQEYDACRTVITEQLGMRVVRFTNEEVRFKIEEVIRKFKDYLTP